MTTADSDITSDITGPFKILSAQDHIEDGFSDLEETFEQEQTKDLIESEDSEEAGF